MLDELRVHPAVCAGLEAADVLLGAAVALATPEHRFQSSLALRAGADLALSQARTLAPDEETALVSGAFPLRASRSGGVAGASSVQVLGLLVASAPPLGTVLGKRVASAFAAKVEAELSTGAALQTAPGSVGEALACLLPEVSFLAGRTLDARAALLLPDAVVLGIRPDLTNGAGGRRPDVLDAVAEGRIPAVAARAVGHTLHIRGDFHAEVLRLRR